MKPPAVGNVGLTKLVSRRDGVVVVCAVCGDREHYGAAIEAARVTTGKVTTLEACYDCIEICGLLHIGRMPCETCGGDGVARTSP